MQGLSKVELPTPTSSPISPKNDVMQDITKVLEKGQESAHQLRRFFNERLGLKAQDHDALAHHSSVTLSSIETVLSILKSCDYDHDEMMIKKRKIEVESCPDQCKSEDIVGGTVMSKERRGCYKRRRTGQSSTVEVSNLTDDGHAWRKYGQKGILHTDYPRNYYRCTHKNDQGCQATKQVQQISENPPRYRLIYHGQHTCKNLLKTPSIILEDCPAENSSIFLSFESNKYPSTAKHALNPSLFPSSIFHTSPATVKQEYTSPIKVESPPSSAVTLDYHSGAHNQYSSSSDNCLPSSSDMTSIGLPSTPVSEQGDVISSAEFHSSTPNPYEMDEDLLNLITLDQHYAPLDGFWDDILA